MLAPPTGMASVRDKPARVVKMAARNRRANVPDVDNTIDLVQVDGLVSFAIKL